MVSRTPDLDEPSSTYPTTIIERADVRAFWFTDDGASYVAAFGERPDWYIWPAVAHGWRARRQLSAPAADAARLGGYEPTSWQAALALALSHHEASR